MALMASLSNLVLLSYYSSLPYHCRSRFIVSLSLCLVVVIIVNGTVSRDGVIVFGILQIHSFEFRILVLYSYWNSS